MKLIGSLRIAGVTSGGGDPSVYKKTWPVGRVFLCAMVSVPTGFMERGINVRDLRLGGDRRGH